MRAVTIMRLWNNVFRVGIAGFLCVVLVSLAVSAEFLFDLEGRIIGRHSGIVDFIGQSGTAVFGVASLILIIPCLQHLFSKSNRQTARELRVILAFGIIFMAPLVANIYFKYVVKHQMLAEGH